MPIIVVLLSMQCAIATGQAQNLNIPPQSLTRALNDYANTANVQLSYPAHETIGLKSNGLEGEYTPQQAL